MTLSARGRMAPFVLSFIMILSARNVMAQDDIYYTSKNDTSATKVPKPTIKNEMNPRLRAGTALTVLALPMGVAGFYTLVEAVGESFDNPGSRKTKALSATSGVLFLFGTVSIIAGPILIHKGRKERKLQESKAYLTLPVLNMSYTKTTGMGFQASMQFHF